jgi:hypothetical protein
VSPDERTVDPVVVDDFHPPFGRNRTATLVMIAEHQRDVQFVTLFPPVRDGVNRPGRLSASRVDEIAENDETFRFGKVNGS